MEIAWSYIISEVWKLSFFFFSWMFEHGLKSTICSLAGFHFLPCSFHYITSQRLHFLLSLEEFFALSVCRARKSDTRWERTGSFHPHTLLHLHMASLHFLAMTVSKNCCITDDGRVGWRESRTGGRACRLLVTYSRAIKQCCREIGNISFSLFAFISEVFFVIHLSCKT